MGLIRDSFLIYRSWDNAIRKAPDEVQLELYHAIMDYAATGDKPQGLSWQAEMLLTSIEINMENTIARYNASVENGKLGGRPRKDGNNVDNSTKNLEEPNKTQFNLAKPSIENQKPSETQDNLEEPTHNLNVNDNVNVNENSSSQSNINNKLNIFSAHACVRELEPKSDEERKFLRNKFNDFWRYGYKSFEGREELALEVIDVIIEASEQARSQEGLNYLKQHYDFDAFFEKVVDKLNEEDLRKIVWSLKTTTEPIQSRPHYILTSVFNRVLEKKI